MRGKKGYNLKDLVLSCEVTDIEMLVEDYKIASIKLVIDERIKELNDNMENCYKQYMDGECCLEFWNETKADVESSIFELECLKNKIGVEK